MPREFKVLLGCEVSYVEQIPIPGLGALAESVSTRLRRT